MNAYPAAAALASSPDGSVNGIGYV